MPSNLNKFDSSYYFIPAKLMIISLFRFGSRMKWLYCKGVKAVSLTAYCADQRLLSGSVILFLSQFVDLFLSPIHGCPLG